MILSQEEKRKKVCKDNREKAEKFDQKTTGWIKLLRDQKRERWQLQMKQRNLCENSKKKAQDDGETYSAWE
jgi:hypothetical protein